MNNRRTQEMESLFEAINNCRAQDMKSLRRHIEQKINAFSGTFLTALHQLNDNLTLMKDTSQMQNQSKDYLLV